MQGSDGTITRRLPPGAAPAIVGLLDDAISDSHGMIPMQGLANMDGERVDKMFVVVTDAVGSAMTPATWPDGSRTTLPVPGARTVKAFLHPDEHASRFLSKEFKVVIDTGAGGAIASAQWFVFSPDAGNPLAGVVPLAGDGSGGLRPMARLDATTGEIVVGYDVRKYTGSEYKPITRRIADRKYASLKDDDIIATPAATRQAYAAANGLPSTLSDKEYTWATRLDAALVDPMTIDIAIDYRKATEYVASPTTDAQRASNLATMTATVCKSCTPAEYARLNGLPNALTLAQYNLAKALDDTYLDKLDARFNYKAHKVNNLGWGQAALAGYTDEPAWHLRIMLDCAMANLFETTPTTVSFSLGFIVGGPHQSFLDMAARFRV